MKEIMLMEISSVESKNARVGKSFLQEFCEIGTILD